MKKKIPFFNRMIKMICVLGLAVSAVACAGAQAEENAAPAGYPEFSWETVPVCLHFSKRDDAADFTDEEISYMADFPIICIEKNQSYKKYGGMEIGTLVAARALKAKNPNTTVLFYMNSNIDWGAYYTTGPMLTDDNRPEWAMKNINGDYVTVHDGARRVFDPSKPEVRRWWHEFVMNVVSDDAIGGVFIDALPKYTATPETRKKQWGEERFYQIYDGLHTMLDSLHAELQGMDKIMIANYLRGNSEVMEDMGTHFFNHTDGAMLEHLAVLSSDTKEYIANDIELIAQAGREGKIVVVKGWPTHHMFSGPAPQRTQEQKEAEAREQITFPLACFLAGAGKYAYFCYSWAYRETDGGLIDFDEYKRPLGEPKADAVREGWIFTRSFEHADIWVDVENKKAEINWK